MTETISTEVFAELSTAFYPSPYPLRFRVGQMVQPDPPTKARVGLTDRYAAGALRAQKITHFQYFFRKFSLFFKTKQKVGMQLSVRKTVPTASINRYAFLVYTTHSWPNPKLGCVWKYPMSSAADFSGKRTLFRYGLKLGHSPSLV